MARKKKSYRIAHRDGETPQVEGSSVGKFGVFAVRSIDRGQWKLDHLPSGRGAGVRGYPSEKGARLVAQALESLYTREQLSDPRFLPTKLPSNWLTWIEDIRNGGTKPWKPLEG